MYCRMFLIALIVPAIIRGMQSEKDSYQNWLHSAVKDGLVDVAKWLLTKDIDVNKQDAEGNMLLHNASINGHQSIVRLLLNAGAQINAQNMEGWTPLHLAASNGHSEVLETLLRQPGINVNLQNKYGRTPLHSAAYRNRMKITKLLLSRSDININSKDAGDMTPLHCAAERGRGSIVTLLLHAAGIDVNGKNKDGETPLHCAAKQYFEGNCESVMALVKCTATDIHARDNKGNTPLDSARKNGNDKIISLLENCFSHSRSATELDLELLNEIKNPSPDNDKIKELVRRGAHCNQQYAFGQTPLHYAAYHNHDMVIKTLLTLPECNVNMVDNDGKTPLHYAAQCGHAAVVTLLLNASNSNSNALDKNNCTPLYLAALNGHEEVVTALINAKEIDPNMQNQGGITALHIAAYNNHDAVVSTLLTVPGIKVNLQSAKGFTPLHCAALKGHSAVLKQLINAPNIESNIQADNGFTPLHNAVRKQRREGVKVLMNAPNLNVNLQDQEGNTPLHITAEWDHDGVMVKTLLNAQEIKVDLPDNRGRTPLHIAALHGNEAVVKIFLERHDVDIYAKSEDGWTLLHAAACGGLDSLVNMLCKLPRFDPTLRTNNGEAPLDLALTRGRPFTYRSGGKYGAVVSALLKQPSSDVCLQDKNGIALLHRAIPSNDKDMVKAILEAIKIDVNAQDDEGGSVLLHAARSNADQVIQAFLEVPNININLQDHNKRTPLHHAARNGSELSIKVLVNAAGIDINPLDDDAWAPLHYAVVHGHKGVVETLLKQPGIEMNAQDIDGQTALHHAVKKGNKTILETLLQFPGITVRIADKKGQTPLDVTRQQDDEIDFLLENFFLTKIATVAELNSVLFDEIKKIQPNIIKVQQLISLGAHINARNEEEETPLHCVRDEGLMKMLLTVPGININAKDKEGMTPLHRAIMFSLPKTDYGKKMIAALLSAQNIDVNVQNNEGYTPLCLAARGGYNWAVRTLLTSPGINATIPAEDGWTPLHGAAFKGGKETIKKLLEQPGLAMNAQIKSERSKGLTPLHFAVQNSRNDVLNQLLCRPEINSNMPDAKGRTPLHYAAQYGREAALRVLLNCKDIIFNLQDNDGKTPLFLVVENEFAQIETMLLVVKMLLKTLQNGVNIPDNNGQTCLHVAAERGVAEMVNLLLDAGAYVNAQNKEGITPLPLATRAAHKIVVESLLRVPGVHITGKDAKGKTALEIARDCGHHEIAALLEDFFLCKVATVTELNAALLAELGKYFDHDIDKIQRLIHYGAEVAIVNKQDKYGWTPLCIASERGHLDVVKALLAKLESMIKIPSKTGWIPSDDLWNTVVKVFLATPEIDINVHDKEGMTFLHHAAENGHEDMVKVLLAAPRISINEPDKSGSTPLIIAAQSGYATVVDALLAASGIKVYVRDGTGATPLHRAAEKGYEMVVKTLLAFDKYDALNEQDKNGFMPLHLAAQNGHAAVVNALVAVSGIKVNVKNKNGATALHSAAFNGDLTVVNILLRAPGINVNEPDALGHTPLYWAAYKGHAAVVNALIGIHESNKNQQNTLHFAVENEYKALVNALLTAPGTDVNAIFDDVTPLDIAIQQSKINVPIVKALLLHGGKCKFYQQKGVLQNFFGGTEMSLNDQAKKRVQQIFNDQPLMLAAIYNKRKEIQKLTRNRRDKKEINQALCYAIGQGHYDSVECLIDALDEINEEIFIHLRLLHKHVLTQEQKKIYERIGSLLDQSAKKRELCAICRDQLGSKKSVILSCCHSFHKECIEPWLKMKSECPDCRCALGEVDVKAIDYRLFIAIGQGAFSEIETLLQKGAHPYAEHGSMTAFTFAALVGRADVVRMLLEYTGINPIKDLQECLSAVVQEILKSNEKKYYDVLRALLEAGAIVDPANGNQVKVMDRIFAENPLALCGLWGNLPELCALINAQPNMAMVKNALRFAIGQGNVDIVKVTLQQCRNLKRIFLDELLEYTNVLFERCRLLAYKNRYKEIIRILNAAKSMQIGQFSLPVSSLRSVRGI